MNLICSCNGGYESEWTVELDYGNDKQAQESIQILVDIFYMLCTLYERFRNFIGAAVRLDRDCTG